MLKFGKTTSMLLVGIVAVLVFAGIAAASVTFDPTCSLTPSNGTGACGFVGKGDVQTALGYNNAQMQQNANSLVFTDSAVGVQAFSQDATQLATQTTIERITCRSGASVVYASEASITSGTLTMSRTGTQHGSLSSTIAYDPRMHNQIDGFFLTGSIGHPTFIQSGDLVWSGFSSSGWVWGNPFEVTSYDPSESSFDACDPASGGNGTIVSDDIGDPIFDYAEVSYGSVVTGDFTPSGSFTLYVGGVALG